jgi:hypothetical protein
VSNSGPSNCRKCRRACSCLQQTCNMAEQQRRTVWVHHIVLDEGQQVNNSCNLACLAV